MFFFTFVALREPNASDIENNGYGYVVASIGEIGGVVPYTSYSARDSYIKNNGDVMYLTTCDSPGGVTEENKQI